MQQWGNPSYGATSAFGPPQPTTPQAGWNSTGQPSQPLWAYPSTPGPNASAQAQTGALGRPAYILNPNQNAVPSPLPTPWSQSQGTPWPPGQNSLWPHGQQGTPWPQEQPLLLSTDDQQQRPLHRRRKSGMPKNNHNRNDTVTSSRRHRSASDGQVQVVQQHVPQLTPSQTGHAANPLNHIFISLVGSHEILVEQAPNGLLVRILNDALSAWTAGLNSFGPEGDNKWKAQFTGHPWSESGKKAMEAQRVLTAIFSVLCNEGYRYATTAYVNSPHPRFVFISDIAADQSEHFALTVTRRGRRIILVGPPDHVGKTLGGRLRSTLEGYHVAIQEPESQVYWYDINPTIIGLVMDEKVVVAHVLKQIDMLGFRLECAIPMKKSGFFSFSIHSPPKEVWIFKARSGR